MSLSPTGGGGGGGSGGQVGGGCGIGTVAGGTVIGGGWRQESPQRPSQEPLKSTQFFKKHHFSFSLSSAGAACECQHCRLEPRSIQLTHKRVSRVTLRKQTGNLNQFVPHSHFVAVSFVRRLTLATVLNVPFQSLVNVNI